MKRFIVMASLAFAFGMTAMASTAYNFTTSASYTGPGSVGGVNCPVGGLCIDFADGTATSGPNNGDPLMIQLDYTPNNGVGVATSADSFGFIQAFCLTSGGVVDTTCGSVAVSGDFTINVSQTVPFAESDGNFIDVLSGTISANSSVGIIDFGTTSFTYTNGTNTLGYFMQQPTFPTVGYDINTPSTNRSTSFQGVIVDESAPEPGDACPDGHWTAWFGSAGTPQAQRIASASSIQNRDPCRLARASAGFCFRVAIKDRRRRNG